MSNIKLVSKDLQSRAQYVSRTIHARLAELAEEARADRWHGSEFLAGLVMAAWEGCDAAGEDLEIVARNMRGADGGGIDKRKFSLLVHPDGRPIRDVR